ncbi:RNA polymerase subunit sigma-70, partial [Streptomyces sp. SID625]|nr:RNA polymerase subunit sigma-70 [Streptomyces sp. SID625]
ARFAREAWHQHGMRGRGRPEPPGTLAVLTPQERLVVVLRLYEGVAEEQAAALLGLPAERVRVIGDRAIATLTRTPARPVPAASGRRAAPS